MVKKIPLDRRIKAETQVAFIRLLSELGYREGGWTPEEDEKYRKLSELAEKHTTTILQVIEKWKEDGSP